MHFQYYIAAITILVSHLTFAQAPITDQTLIDAQDDSSSWLNYSRNYEGWRYMPVDQINRDTVNDLEVAWKRGTGVGMGQFETSAVVANGRMFITTQESHLIAVDPKTGETLWRYDYEFDRRAVVCCGPVNRGVAVYGDMVYWGTLDAYLFAFDAATGDIKWKTHVADNRYRYSITGAPLVADGKVITGVGGGEYGIRGFIAAYDAMTGEEIWRFYAIPGEGEPGNDTWEGDSWKTGGAPTWLTGTYDAELGLVYWGTGNPGPDLNRTAREGINLYSNSIVAVDIKTGKLKWYFQPSPRDEFDWDGINEPVLVDEVIDGKMRKAVAQANRNGFLYLLDRETGEFLYAKPYTRANWYQYNDQGIPELTEEMLHPKEKVVYPGLFGGKNWPPSAYNPNTHLMYIPDQERGSIFTRGQSEYRPGLMFFGGNVQWENDGIGFVRAVDLRTGEKKWEFKTEGGPNWAGMLATGGGLVFGGDNSGILRAFNDETGEVLWTLDITEINNGVKTGILAPPTSFTIEGKQYIGLAIGGRDRHRKDSTYVLLGLKD
jgi:alcohol dehydrogenase (cytochrome c)